MLSSKNQPHAHSEDDVSPLVLVLAGLPDPCLSQTGQHQPGIPGVIGGGTQARLINEKLRSAPIELAATYTGEFVTEQ
jgi:hypothetical protein